MSYTDDMFSVEDLKLRIVSTNDLDQSLIVSFECPRCHEITLDHVTYDEIFRDLELMCRQNVCYNPSRHGKRYGFKLFIERLLRGYTLGTCDRPLDRSKGGSE